MLSRSLSFRGSTGAEISARLDLPSGTEPSACVLFAHSFPHSPDPGAATHISRSLTQAGTAVFRFGLASTRFSSGVDDLLAAARFLEGEGMAPDVLAGHSLGGAAAVRAAREVPSARAVATIAAPFDPLDEADLRGLGRALLVFHSPLDQQVGIENAARIYQAARHPKSFISLGEADHLLTDERDSRYVGTVLAAWATRYLPHPEPPRTVEELRARHRVVTLTGESGYRTEVRAGEHGMLADEPVAVGGTDEGPTPYDYLMAGLGACTGITLRMYADRKGWPLEEVEVRLRHERQHAEDEAVCAEGGEARMDRIEREVAVRGPLDPRQRARLLEIAERCPVHRTLSAGVRVDTTAAPDS